MIFTDRKVTVNGNKATIDRSILLYRGDREIEIRFTVIYSEFKYRNNEGSNLIEDINAAYGQLVIQNDVTTKPIVSKITPTQNGTVVFTFTEKMIDEIPELGTYDFQIRLFDSSQASRLSTPIVDNGVIIEEPLSIDEGDSNEIGLALINKATVTTSEPLDAFDANGNYIQTNWKDGDLITNVKMNKIEEGIAGVDEKVPYMKLSDLVTTDGLTKFLYIDNLEADKIYQCYNDLTDIICSNAILYVRQNEESTSTISILDVRYVDTLIKIGYRSYDKTLYYSSQYQYVTINVENSVRTVDELYSLSQKPSKSTVLTKTNTTEYTPTTDYHPATKKYVDDAISSNEVDLSNYVTKDEVVNKYPVATISSTNIVEKGNDDFWINDDDTSIALSDKLDTFISLTINGTVYSKLFSADLFSDGDLFYYPSGSNDDFPLNIYFYSSLRYIEIYDYEFNSLPAGALTKIEIIQYDYSNKIRPAQIENVRYEQVTNIPPEMEDVLDRNYSLVPTYVMNNLIYKNYFRYEDYSFNETPYTDTGSDNEVNTTLNDSKMRVEINNKSIDGTSKGKGLKINFRALDKKFSSTSAVINFGEAKDMIVLMVRPDNVVTEIILDDVYKSKTIPNIQEGDYYFLFTKTNDYLNWFNAESMMIYAISNQGILDTRNLVTEQKLNDSLHEHTNKDILDAVTQEKVSSWDGKQEQFITKLPTGMTAVDYYNLANGLYIVSETLSFDTTFNLDNVGYRVVPAVYDNDIISVYEEDIINLCTGKIFTLNDIGEIKWQADIDNNQATIPCYSIEQASDWGWFQSYIKEGRTVRLKTFDGSMNFDVVYTYSPKDQNDVYDDNTILIWKGILGYCWKNKDEAGWTLDNVVSIEAGMEDLYSSLSVLSSSIPTKTSDLTNDSGFLTSIPSDYITEQELNNRLHEHTNKDILDAITEENILDNTVVIDTVRNNILKLTTDRIQFVDMENIDPTAEIDIELPIGVTGDRYTEIHLYFKTTSSFTMNFPGRIAWKLYPTIQAEKIYEIILIHINDAIGWLGEYIEYEQGVL